MNQRRGYTLIELLVVMSLMAILAALAILFFPNAASNQTEARAAMNVQGWLNVAKQRAMRDQAPRGLRLIVTTDTFGSANIPNVVKECQYVEQPDDFSGGTIVTMAPVATKYPNLQLGGGIDLTNGDPNPAYWHVQPGIDRLEILGSGLVRLITQVGAAGPNSITVTPPLDYPIPTTPSYRIIRAPRAVGDETLKMPSGTVIDLGTNYGTYGFFSPLPTQVGNTIDILFGPSGAVISPGVSAANLNLWIRTPDSNNPTDPFKGAPTIVSVFVRTGLVGAYPPVPGATPYSLVN